MEEIIELTPEERRREQDELTRNFGEKFGIEKILNFSDKVEDCKVGYYLVRPYPDGNPYKNHVVLARVCEDGSVRVFDTLDNCHYNKFNEDRVKSIKDIFGTEKISFTDIRLESRTSKDSQLKITQRSTQGCFEMCLALAMLHSIRQEKLRQAIEQMSANNDLEHETKAQILESEKRAQMTNLVKEANSFAEMIRLKKSKGSGTKLATVKKNVIEYFQKHEGFTDTKGETNQSMGRL